MTTEISYSAVWDSLEIMAALSFGEYKTFVYYLELGYSVEISEAPKSEKRTRTFICYVYSIGSIPSFYREVYHIACPNQEEKIDRDMFIKILVKSSLPKQTLSVVRNDYFDYYSNPVLLMKVSSA